MQLSRVQVPCVTYFDAQLQILDLLEHKAIFTAGYKAILHLHSLVEECEITRLLAQVNVKTKEKKKARLMHCPCSERAHALSQASPAKPHSPVETGPRPSSHVCLALSPPAGPMQASRWHTEWTALPALDSSASCR